MSFVFFDENNHIIDHLHIEDAEQRIANQFLLPTDQVLELGARYGTVSCTIARLLNAPNRLVSIEPDARVIETLKRNQERNNCKFHIVYGSVSSNPMSVGGCGYVTETHDDPQSNIPHYTVDQLQQQFGLVFNALVVDCEGCFEAFFRQNESFVRNLRLVTFEQDMPHRCDYNWILQRLQEFGFVRALGGFHEVWIKHAP